MTPTTLEAAILSISAEVRATALDHPNSVAVETFLSEIMDTVEAYTQIAVVARALVESYEAGA